jgi:hypothetical protein
MSSTVGKAAFEPKSNIRLVCTRRGRIWQEIKSLFDAAASRASSRQSTPGLGGVKVRAIAGRSAQTPSAKVAHLSAPIRLLLLLETRAARPDSQSVKAVLY